MVQGRLYLDNLKTPEGHVERKKNLYSRDIAGRYTDSTAIDEIDEHNVISLDDFRTPQNDDGRTTVDSGLMTRIEELYNESVSSPGIGTKRRSGLRPLREIIREVQDENRMAIEAAKANAASEMPFLPSEALEEIHLLPAVAPKAGPTIPIEIVIPKRVTPSHAPLTPVTAPPATKPARVTRASLAPIIALLFILIACALFMGASC